MDENPVCRILSINQSINLILEFQRKIKVYLINIIKNHPQITLDELSEIADVATYKILPLLLEIEILGYIKSFSGRQFQVI